MFPLYNIHDRNFKFRYLILKLSPRNYRTAGYANRYPQTRNPKTANDRYGKIKR